MSMSISIITINYNNIEGLKKTIKSVTEQTWQDFQYIVIDGGSTDGSAAYIESHKDKIGYWISEKDSGIYNAMNKGIAKATGNYIVFMNSGDCFISPSTLKSCSKIMEKKDADVFYGQIKIDGNDGDKTVVYPKKMTLKYMKNNVINHQACFFKLTTILDNNGYDEKYELASDYHYYLKLYMLEKTFHPLLFPVVKYDTTGISSFRMAEYKIQMKKVWRDTIPASVVIPESFSVKVMARVRNYTIVKLAFKIRRYLIQSFHAK